MTDIQRYIQRPNGMVSDGCGKWCIYSEAKKYHIKAMEDKDNSISFWKERYEIAAIDYKNSQKAIEAIKANLEKCKECNRRLYGARFRDGEDIFNSHKVKRINEAQAKEIERLKAENKQLSDELADRSVVAVRKMRNSPGGYNI